MAVTALRCAHCAAAFDASPIVGGTLRCIFCGRTSNLSEGAVGLELDDPDAHPGEPRLEVDGLRLVILGKIASGESSDVFLASTDRRLAERVILKLLRSPSDADLLRREWSAVSALSDAAAQGSAYFSTLLPQSVRHGVVRASSSRAKLASVFRYRPGFVHTLYDLEESFPGGVPAGAAVWIWKRLLEVLGWVHRSGYAHGAVLPRHILVQPRDHGVSLVGWTCAARLGEPLVARVTDAMDFYPEAARSGCRLSPAIDLAMAARCVVSALGGDVARGEPPKSLPGPLFGLLRASARLDLGAPDDAWELKEEVSLAARAALGPSRFQPLSIPGWR